MTTLPEYLQKDPLQNKKGAEALFYIILSFSLITFH